MNGRALWMKGISKSFPGVKALSDVSIQLEKGETLALVGENGAGKSTLMKVLGGVYAADDGEIFIDGTQVKISSPLAALELGVSIIYQEFNLAPTLSVAENMHLGKELRKGWGMTSRLDREAMCERAAAVMERLGMRSLNVRVQVGELPVAKRQLVEIGKALLNEARILVMDEPTAVLTERESGALFEVMDKLKSQGISIIYISHRLEEVQSICDRITILRDGQYITTLDNHDRRVEKDEIVKHMVGRDMTDYYPAGAECIREETVLAVSRLTKGGMFENVSFELRKGEILGFSGLIGAGRTEVAKTIFGEYQPDAGEILLEGKPMCMGIRAAIHGGVTLVPEDRKQEGLVLGMSLADNTCLPNAGQVSSNGVFRSARRAALVTRLVESLSIRPALPHRTALEFSGGNQQKAVIAKWLATNPKVLILDEPTRGVDVGAKAEIYTLMRRLTAEGVGIIFISSEMPELLGMCDRILVICEGRATGEFHKGEMDQRAIMRAAAGL